MKKKTGFFIVGIFLIAMVYIGFRIFSEQSVISWGFDANDPSFNYIAHAGGGIDGAQYTNSKEAFENSIKNGYKLIEIDLIESRDGVLVAAHDWKHFNASTSYPEKGEEGLLVGDFLDRRVLGRYSVLSGSMVDRYLKNNPSIFLVTDKTNNFKLLRSTFSNSSRLFVEVFGTVNYIKAVLSGVRRPMYSLHIGRLGEYFAEMHMKFLGARYVAIHSADLIKYPGLFSRLSNDGVKIFVYSSNEKKFVNWAVDNFNATVYTDFLRVDNGECQSEHCVTY